MDPDWFKQIDAKALVLFREKGGLDMDWSAVDESVRTHYRILARKELERVAS